MPAEGDFEVRRCLISNFENYDIRDMSDVKEEKLSQQIVSCFSRFITRRVISVVIQLPKLRISSS